MPPQDIQAQVGRGSRVSWRPFPCPSCGKGRSPGDVLRESFFTGQHGVLEELDQQIKIEVGLLVEWANSCPHVQTEYLDPPLLAEGSEHSVYLRPKIGAVYKVTLPGIYGDWYYLEDGKVHQQTATPFDYLIRLEIWDWLFGSADSQPEGSAPIPVGITPSGQIVTRQKFIETAPASQGEVDELLERDGWEPVKKSAFIWRKEVNRDFEVRLGDARDENFAIRDGRLVPIDIRLWFVTVLPPEPS